MMDNTAGPARALARASHQGGRAEAWMVPPCTRGSVSLSLSYSLTARTDDTRRIAGRHLTHGGNANLDEW
jgi:hypothetical protein